MPSNKEYRKYEGFEDALYLMSEIVDLADDCKDDIRYATIKPETFEQLDKIIAIAIQVRKMISTKEEIID